MLGLWLGLVLDNNVEIASPVEIESPNPSSQLVSIRMFSNNPPDGWDTVYSCIRTVYQPVGGIYQRIRAFDQRILTL